MDGRLTDGRTGGLWMCSKHSTHALGLAVRVEVDGRFVDRLLLFRNTVDIGDMGTENMMIALPTSVQPRGYVEGTMHDIECDLCAARRTWWMGEAALERFIVRRRGLRGVR